MRKAFEGGQGSWSKKRDGEEAMYDCMFRWATWGVTARQGGDEIPKISGELTHSFADGQLSHYLTVLVRQAGSADGFNAKMATAARKYSQRPNEDLGQLLKTLGKCHVVPTSWTIDSGTAMTSAKFMRAIFNETYGEAFPSYVKTAASRRTFDRMIMEKDFVGAANLGAELHGRNDKTTVMWNEVLTASRLSVAQGRGTELSDALLSTLSKVWWPKSNRSVAQGLLMKKHGRTVNRPQAPKQPDVPYWAQQEWERYIGGRTNYTPCNQWYKAGC